MCDHDEPRQLRKLTLPDAAQALEGHGFDHAGSVDHALVVGLDPAFNGALSTATTRLSEANEGPAKLAGALGHTLEAVAKHASALPEHAQWTASLSAAKGAIDSRNTSVRLSRSERREATPEIAAARAQWFKAYGAAKLIVEAVLRYPDRTALLHEVSDHLAEVHRAAGVSDGDSAAEAPPAKPE